MNKYLKNLEKIEFVLTYACTGKCKHCSEGEHTPCEENIDADISVDCVRKVAAEYDIKTVMTFGGEPLLYPDTVYAIMRAARDARVPRRQIITNGYFSQDARTIRNTAERLFDSGVNDILLSVDAFHQETIPKETVRMFAAECKKIGIPIRLQPAWLVNREDDNTYNRITREVLDFFCDLEIPVGDGNVVFFEGNAIKYLSEYFSESTPEKPYIENPCDVKCLSFSPNGDVLSSNVYKKDIMEILREYNPERCGI